MDKKEWNFAEVWNKSLEREKERPLEKRDHLWASELGKSPIDVFLKLRAEEPTNPPNARSRRKFVAGNIWEDILKMILTRAGILITDQERCEYQYEGLMKVTGKLDFKAGGKPDYEKSKQALEELRDSGIVSEDIIQGGIDIVEYLSKEFPEGLPTKILEIKSVSAFMFDGIESRSKSLKIHRIQLYHYLKSLNEEKGDIVYICKDDCRMIQIPVSLNDEEVEKEYKQAIETISRYHFADEQPPLEEPVIWDEDLGKFAKNFNVAYSMYLTKLYGFKDQAEFDDKFTAVSASWNRVITRIREGKDMTANNEEKLAEMAEAGYKPEMVEVEVPLEDGTMATNKVLQVNRI